MKNRKKWKRAISFTFALAVTAGVLSNNAAGLLGGAGISAAAAEAAGELPDDLSPEENDADETELSQETDETEQSGETDGSDTGAEDTPNEPVAIGEAGDTEVKDKAARTVMVYIAASNLESDQGSATFNLHQILNSDFGNDGDVRVVIMTGGSDQWFTESEYLYDPATGTSPEEISNVYNQIWEAKGINDENNPGQLVLVDGDGLSGDGEDAKESIDEPMSYPETLKAFINYAAENYPAEMYDLILWDHGGGPVSGFGHDAHLGMDSDLMSFAGMIDAISDNDVTRDGGKFDFIDFDACMMCSLDIVLAFADYTDYFIASPESEPGFGQEYKCWLDVLGEDPYTDTFELGKIMADGMMYFYEGDTESDGYGQSATLSVIDIDKLLDSDFLPAMSDFTQILHDDLYQKNAKGEYFFYDELYAWDMVIDYEPEYPAYYDLGVVLSVLSGNTPNFLAGNDTDTYAEPAERVLGILSDTDIIYARATSDVMTDGAVEFVDEDGNRIAAYLPSSGIFLPALDTSYMFETKKYFTAMDDALALMPDNESSRFLKEYLDVLNDYCIIMLAGSTVSCMSDMGEDSENITVDTVFDFWKEDYDPEDETANTVWDAVDFFLERHPGGEEAVKAWLEPYISQMAAEVFSADNFDVKIVEGEYGDSIAVFADEVSKRVVDEVILNCIVELPVAEEYWSNSPDADYRDQVGPAVVLADFFGRVQYDLGEGENFDQRKINWFANSSTVWDMDGYEEMWYAVNDADGELHVAAYIDLSDGWSYVPALAYDEEGNESLVFIYFCGSDLDCIQFFDEDLNYLEMIDATDLEEEYEIMPIQLDLTTGLYLMIPISRSTFVISSENCDQITLDYTEITNIPDIGDTDGDGRAVRELLVVRDIYDYSFDLTDKLIQPSGSLVSIADAEVQQEEYDATAKRPVVTYDGNVLTEGEDYSVFCTDGSETFVDAGCYDVFIYGMGEFGGSMRMFFEIVDPDDFATRDEFARMAAIDYEKKTGVSVFADAIRNTDGTVTITIMDEAYNVLDVYNVDAKTGVGTDYSGEEVDLPQTGMSGVHTAAAGLAALMLLSGVVLVKKSRREDWE